MYYGRTRKLLLSFAIAIPVIAGSSLIFILDAYGKSIDPQTLDKHRVVVLADNHNITVDTHAETVGEVLQQLNIAVGKQDLVEPATITKLDRGTQIRVTRVSQNESESIEEIPFATVKYEDPDLLIGQEQVIQEGIPGKERVKRSMRIENGLSVTEKELSRVVISPYTPKVVAVGTAVPVQIPEQISNVSNNDETLAEGAGLPEEEGLSDEVGKPESLPEQSSNVSTKPKVVTIEARPVNYKFKLDTVELTAYTAGFESTGKNPGDHDYGITASGTTVEEGRTIAVDPTVIPLGWWVYIEGVGYRKAEDTGSAIKGEKIDVYIPELEKAKKFGRKYGNTVYVIGPQKPN